MVKRVSHRVVVRNGYEILADPDDSAKIQQHRERMLKFFETSSIRSWKIVYDIWSTIWWFFKNDTEEQLPFHGKVQDSSDDEPHVFASHDQEKQKIVISSVDEIQDDTISSVDKKAD